MIKDWVYSNKKYLLAAAAVFILLMPFLAFFLGPADAKGKSVDFAVRKGDGIFTIARNLREAGLIRSPAVFLAHGVFAGALHRLKAGNYKLSQQMSLPAISRALVAGPIEDMVILAKEGETMAEIEKKLVAAGVLKAGQLTKRPGKSLEGFLFPDTYRFFRNSDEEEVIGRFLNNFYEKAMPVLKDAQNVYEALIVASIIEKEVPFPEDRYLVAGVLYKRLKIGMGLQVDAAPETYKVAGLPKAPISNPGITAIQAAVYPKDGGYLYYLSDPATKKTIFAKTFEEHKENKWKYLKK